MDPTTRRLLEAPIAPTLLALAAPNVLMLVSQVALNVLEAYFVGWLGADALAGVSVTFPLVMLMQTMSAGGMGGGVASAVGRAPRARPRAGAGAPGAHAIRIAPASVVRGTGNMRLPAGVAVGGGAVLLGLSPALIFGWGPLPRLGVRGAAVALVIYYGLGALVFLGYLVSGRSLVTLAPRAVRL